MRYADFLKCERLGFAELLALSQGNLVDDPPSEFVRLPAPPLLMMDRVTRIERRGAQGLVIAERDVRLDDWFFQCHFRGDPVQPGCLGLDAVWQLVGLYAALAGGVGSGRALGCREVQFFGQIRPHDRCVRYEVEVRRFSILKQSGAALAIADGRVLVDDALIYQISAAKVGLFRGLAYSAYPHPGPRAVGGVLDRGDAPC
ncbi:MAG: bifunctional 3-hydroxydecanoyl-ACP dehydratase/trans-2-decenoyl-ACP isomerase [Myxococcota bacterium]